MEKKTMQVMSCTCVDETGRGQKRGRGGGERWREIWKKRKKGDREDVS